MSGRGSAVAKTAASKTTFVQAPVSEPVLHVQPKSTAVSFISTEDSGMDVCHKATAKAHPMWTINPSLRQLDSASDEQ